MPSRRAALHGLLPLALWGTLVALSLAGVEARYSAPALAALAAIQLLLAATLYLLLAAGRRLGTAAGYAAAVAVALVLVWHCRELTYRPSSLLAVPAAALVLALPIHAWMRAGPEPWPLRRLLPALAAAGIATAVAVAAAFEGSNLLRWHLLRHNKLFGTPAYYALAAGVAELREELFARHRAGDVGVSEDQDEDEGRGGGPHLVFIVLDTLRADALAMGGGDRDVMPRLNAFLDGAYRFTDVMANASWTRPSIASMLTGLAPEEHGARDVDDPLEERFTTLAETLGRRGYGTAALVSNVGAVGRSAGFAQGFDFFHEFSATPYARAGQIRDALERWLAERGGGDGRPLFLYLHFLDPHEPYLAGRVPAHKSFSEYAAAYRAELAYLDVELARTIEALEAALPGPKAYLVASDHGEEFGEHEEFGHGYSLYREVIHIPVAFHVSDGGGTLDAPLEGRDVHDLVARWAAAGGRLDVGAWAAARRRGERHASVYYSSRGRLLLRPYLRRVVMRAVDREGMKLIWSAYGATFELYEVGRDPAERRNLAAERSATTARLAGFLDRGVVRWNFPRPYERSPEELEQLRALGYIGD